MLKNAVNSKDPVKIAKAKTLFAQANQMFIKEKKSSNLTDQDLIADSIADSIAEAVEDSKEETKKKTLISGFIPGSNARKAGLYTLGALTSPIWGLPVLAKARYDAEPSLKITADIDNLTTKLKEGIKPINKVTSIVKEIKAPLKTSGPSVPSVRSGTPGLIPADDRTDSDAADAEAAAEAKERSREVAEAERRGAEKARAEFRERDGDERIAQARKSEEDASQSSIFSDKEKEYYMARLGLYVPDKDGKNIFYKIGLPLTKDMYDRIESDLPNGTTPENFFSSLFSEVKDIDLPIVKTIFPSTSNIQNESIPKRLERSILSGNFSIDINNAGSSDRTERSLRQESIVAENVQLMDRAGAPLAATPDPALGTGADTDSTANSITDSIAEAINDNIKQ